MIVKIDNGLDARAKSLNETLAQRAMEVAQVLGEGGRQVTRALDSKAQEIDNILVERSTALSETLSSKAQEINAVLGGRADEIASTLDTRITNFEERVVGRLNSVSDEIETRGRSVTDNLENRMLLLNDRMRERGEMLSEIISGRTAELQSLIETQGPMLVDLIASKGADVSHEIAQVAEQAAASIEQRTTSVTQSLAQTGLDLRNSIETSSDSLDATKNRLRTEISALLEQLRETSGALQQVVGQAGDNLAGVEGALVARVNDFTSAIDHVNSQVHALSDTAVTTLESADAVAARIEQSNSYLAGISAQVAQNQRDVNETLDARRVSLDATIAGMEARTHEFESLMRTFAVAVDDAFRRAEARARDIGGFITESTQSAAGLIASQYDEVRNASAQEHERTAAALRQSFAEANAEIADLFGAALERFRNASGEIHGMSGEIKRELEATRNELRRGAVELPRETAEQASAMRRVVAEQIKALNELNDIIARSGRAYDIAEPVAPRRAELAAPAPRRAEAPRVPEPARVTETMRVQQETPRAPEPVRMAEAYRAEEPAPAPAPAPVRRPVTNLRKPAPAAPASQDKGAGWLSDLLARASRDEGDVRERVRPAPVSLDAITMDIARMVNHEAAVDLWDRYNRGENNLFSRRLYTPQGQQAFDEISRRYRSEPEFRDTVDRYTSEFERLLTEVSRSDRDGMMTRTYLTSETGKVYTMLAHAAGHFE